MAKWHPQESWNEAKYEELLDRIAAEAEDLTSQLTPDAWNTQHEYLNAVTRTWSLSVARHVKAICLLLDRHDMITPLGLMRELRDRAIDLRLLLHYKNKAVGYDLVGQKPFRKLRFAARCQAALAARLTQALTQYSRSLADPRWQAVGWGTLRGEIRAMRKLLPAEISEEIDNRAKDWRRFRHWSGIEEDQVRGKVSGVDPMEDQLASAKMSIQLHGSLELMEVERLRQRGNKSEYRPMRKSSSDAITITALVVWFYLRAAADAAKKINKSEEC